MGFRFVACNGEVGIRTRETGISPSNGLANRIAPDASNATADTCEDSPERLGVLLGASGPEIAPQADPADADLAAVVSAWPALPDALKAGILAMVGAVVQGKGKSA